MGTDGFGLSDNRDNVRRHFDVDAQSIVVHTLRTLAARGDVEPDVPGLAARRYGPTGKE